MNHGPERRPRRHVGLRRSRSSPGGDRRRYWSSLILAALFGAIAASFITEGLPYRAWDRVADALEDPPPEPTIQEEIVTEYVRQTRTGTFWAARPTVFPQSVLLMKSKFKQFNPLYAHDYLPTPKYSYVPELIHAAPALAGNIIEVLGQVTVVNVLSPPTRRNTEWLLQLRPVFNDQGLLYCRITLRNRERPTAGEYRVVRGIVLAAGAISLSRGGFAPGVYMACSSWRLPRGAAGTGLRISYLLDIDLRALMRKHGSKGVDAAWLKAVDAKLPLSIKRRLPALVRASGSRAELERRTLRLLEQTRRAPA